MPDILKLLRRFSWRGIELPLLSRRAGHAHEQVNHPLIFQDGELVESTGAKNWSFTYTIPFREGIVKGPYRNLFLQTFQNEFLPAYLDRSDGELVDPVHGPVICKPMSYSEETDSNRRDGEDIEVTFTRSPEQDTSDEIAGELASIESIDERAAFLGVSLRKALVEAEQEPVASLADPLDVLTGIGAQFEVAGDRIAAKADAMAFRAEKLEAQIETLQNPQNAPLIRSLRRLRQASGKLKSRVINPVQIPVTITVPTDMSMSVLAAAYNMSLVDLQRLNPRLRLHAKAGSKVQVYPSGGPI